MPTGSSQADGSKAPASPARRSGPPLPPAEIRRRRRELVMSGIVGVAILAVVVVEERVSGIPRAFPFGDSLLFLFLNALNVFLIFLLVYLIGRNLVKLVFERRRGILGSHLNLKFVFAFFVIAAVPTAVLALVSSSLISASIETWFSLQVDRALRQSREVADAYYRAAAANALFYGRRIAHEITERRLMREAKLGELEHFVQEKQREYNLGVVEVFSATGEELVSAVNPEVPAANFSRPESALVKAALAGEERTIEQEAGSGSVIRGVVPIASSFRPGEAVGTVVVNYYVPYSLKRKVASIRAALDEYRKLQPNASHIRRVYQLELALFAFVVLLFAIWWGIRMAKGVTGPIRALAEGTAEVARGNLDVQVEATSDDEIGFLVHSFNRMTRDLRETRKGLEQSNAELDRRRRYTEIVLRNVGAGVISLDAEGRVQTVNPAAQMLLGIPPGVALVGRRIEDVLARPEQREAIRELRRQLRPGVRESIRRQVELTVGDETLTLLVNVTLLKDEEGEVLGSVVVLDDYSQLVKVQRMEAWQEVARRIAHEIRNPLTPINLSAERIRRRFRSRVASDPAEAEVFDKCIDAIRSQVETLQRLVGEFSNFARLPQANPKPDDLNALVEETVASYAGTAGIRFETELDVDLPRVDLDREQIRRVLANLIENAVAAIREREGREGLDGEGRIVVRTAYEEAFQIARLEVVDNGIGIAPEDRRRIFEPYFSTKKQGTGLGLAIVSRIVSDHRGYVRVEEASPRGTCCVVELPIRWGRA